MQRDDDLRFGPLTDRCAHLCVDMQNLFREGTAWHTPWLDRVLPRVTDIAAAHPERTTFTRFIPAERPGEGQGTWRRYYEKWADVTLERLEPAMVDLVPELAGFVPPARVVDKWTYSPWLGPELHESLQRDGIDTLVVTGGETDVCVLATVLGAIDRGYRTVIVTDALCSSSDTTHEALLTLYRERYGQQVETATTATILAAWA